MKTILCLMLALSCLASKCADQPNDSRTLKHLTLAQSFDDSNGGRCGMLFDLTDSLTHFTPIKPEKISTDHPFNICYKMLNAKKDTATTQMKHLDLTQDPRLLAFTILIDSNGKKTEIKKVFGTKTFEIEGPTISGDSTLISLQKHVEKAIVKENCGMTIVAGNEQAVDFFSTAMLKSTFKFTTLESIESAINIINTFREQHPYKPN